MGRALYFVTSTCSRSSPLAKILKECSSSSLEDLGTVPSKDPVKCSSSLSLPLVQ